MKKFYKISGVICGIFFVVGSGCIIASLFLGVSFTGLYEKLLKKTNSYSSYKNESVDKEYIFENLKVNSLSIKVGSGDLQIEESMNNQIHLINEGDNNVFKAKVNGDVLEVYQVSSNHIWNHMRDHKAILQIPADYKFNDVNITVGSGDMKGNYLETGLFTTKVGSGDLEFELMKADKVNIVSGSGDVDISLVGNKSEYNCNVDSGSGDVQIEDSYHTDDHHSNNNTEKTIDIKSGSGDVEIGFR